MKEVGKVKVFKTEEVKGKDFHAFRCLGFTDDGDVMAFYRPFDEAPKKDDVYSIVFRVNSRDLKGGVTIQK